MQTHNFSKRFDPDQIKIFKPKSSHLFKFTCQPLIIPNKHHRIPQNLKKLTTDLLPKRFSLQFGILPSQFFETKFNSFSRSKMRASRILRVQLNKEHWDRRVWETGYRGTPLAKQKA